MQTTLIILKPDAVQRGKMGEIISRIENKGLKIVGGKFMQITRKLAEKHYAVHAGRPFYESLVAFMTSSPVMVLAVQGPCAIEVMRKLMGQTAGYEADPGTIRGDLGVSKGLNLIHGSDGEETAASELKLFFQEGELVDYQRPSDAWVIDQD